MYQMWPVTNLEIIFGQYSLFVLTYPDYQTFILGGEESWERESFSLLLTPPSLDRPQ